MSEGKETVTLSPKLEGLAKGIVELTVLEASDLVKWLEQELGIQAAVPMADRKSTRLNSSH